MVIGLIYLFLTVIGYFFRGENWDWDPPYRNNQAQAGAVIHPVLSGFPDEYKEGISLDSKTGKRYEGCLVCHDGMKGLSVSHDPAAIGCTSCHGGDPFTLDKKKAHSAMILIPGNLWDASRSCGTAECHPVVTARVHNSLMSTLSGMVSVNRFVFGESESLSVLSHIENIGHTAADEHLRDLCAHCHLGNEKIELGPLNQLSRGGGCNACHLNHSESSLKELESRPEWIAGGISPEFHPSLSVNITDEHCFGCHSRSGRIAFNYMGYHETLLEADQVAGDDKYHVLEDKRVVEKMPPDVHHEAGMSCIDCHISFGLMGDGNLYHHEEQQVKIACDDCHFTGDPETVDLEYLDYEAAKIARLRGLDKPGEKFLVSRYSGYAMVNTKVNNEGAFLVGKKDGLVYPLSPPAEVCIRTSAHRNLDCNSCHSSRVPQCIGCHNEYDQEAEGFDLLDYKEKRGEWVEYIGQYLSDRPVLGIADENEGMKTIGVFAPGMILSIDKSSYTGDHNDEPIFHRLYSPVSPHTTVTESRSCISCHLDPLAIGYGRGKLEYRVSGASGNFSFEPRFAKREEDGLPEDAWLPFMGERSETAATRPWARPFSLEEQQRILLVGSCLHCHDEGTEMMEQSLWNFEEVLQKRSSSCILPVWYTQE